MDFNNSEGGLLSKLVGTPQTDTERDARTTGSALAWALVFGLFFAISWQPRYWAASCTWASACALVGMLIGFLFGIPRYVARNGVRTASPARNDGANQAPVLQSTADQQQLPASSSQTAPGQQQTLAGINTNLEEISDWLTKIIVGVSLVELQKAIAKLQQAAGFIAQSLGGSSQSSFSYGLMVYFSIAGFLGSYLLTRLYLQRAFRDAAADL